MRSGELGPRMRYEVDDGQGAAWTQHPSGFGERPVGIVEEVHHVVQHDDVDDTVGEIQCGDVAQADLTVVQGTPFEAVAGDGEHVATAIDAEPAADLRAGELEDATGTGAEVEQVDAAQARDQVDQRALDGCVGGVVIADEIPFGRMAAEVVLGLASAVGADLFEATPVPTHIGVVGFDGVENGPDESPELTGSFETEQRGGALGVAVHQTGVAEDTEMPADTGLALSEDGDEFGHRELVVGEQGEDPKPGGFTRCLQCSDQCLHDMQI